MDEADMTLEMQERQEELRRKFAAAQPKEAVTYTQCRFCDESLDDPVLMKAGFCDSFCRDEFEKVQKMRAITGRVSN